MTGAACGATALCLAVLGLWLRVLPRLRNRQFGVDAWYYLTVADAFRQTRRAPVTLPYYAFDPEEQWYPPVFGWVLSRFPQRWLERWHWLGSPLIDTAHLLLVYGVALAVSKSWLAAAVSGGVYATFPLLATQHSNLNSRALGSVFLTVVMLLLCQWSRAGGLWAVAVVGMGVVLLHTHKFSTQQMVFLLLGCAVLDASWAYIGFLIGIWATALTATRRGYLNILRGHVSFLRYWRRHLPWLGAHMVYDSPLYGVPEKAVAMRGVRGLRSSAVFTACAYLHGALVAAVALSAPWWREGGGDFWWMWCVGVTGAIVITSAPWLRFLGESFRYAMYLACPASILIGQFAVSSAPMAWRSAAVTALMALGVLVSVFLGRAQGRSFLATQEDDYDAVIDWFRRSPRDGVICVPMTRAESVAYRAGKRVLAGGHGAATDALAEFFPVIRRPLDELAGQYDMSYLLIDQRYALIGDLRLPASWARVFERGPFVVCERGEGMRTKG